MTQRFTLFAVSLLLLLGANAQSEKEETPLDYYSAITRMLVLYGDMKYDSALVVFKQAQGFKDRLTATDYYYGAACAALVHQPVLAMNHLRESVKKGWLDTLRLQEDNAFDSLKTTRAWKPLMADIRLNYKKLLELFKGVKGKDLYDLLPYTDGTNWGWADRKTGTPVTAASFEYTRFAGDRGIAFAWNDGAFYYLNNKFTIHTPEQSADADAEPEARSEKALAAFEAANNNRFTLVKEEKGVNVKSSKTGGLVFKHNYESIEDVEEVKGNVFFMVSANGIRFYVDERGKEFVKRPS